MVSEPQRTRRYRVNRSKPNTVRLWTLQEIAVWDSLRKEGQLCVDPALRDLDPYFREPYDWMCSQMLRRIFGYQGHDPWWAYDYPVDLRSYRYHAGSPGERMVRLELAVPWEQVLLSAYGSWHYVLSQDYLPQASDEEAFWQENDTWELERQALVREGKDWMMLEPYRTRVMRSWERIFDVEELRAKETIQATFEVLRLADVVSVTEFTVAHRKSDR